jgi:Fe(3+) dicitrate transport protein
VLAGAGWPLAAQTETSAADEPVEEATEAAEEPSSEEAGEAEEYRLFEELLVVGSPEAVRRVPGSAHVIDAGELERQGFQDVHRVLRQIPGVNIQEEDGFGLRPNIGIRGTGVERSQKVTLLEDGVLIAPAPYSAPAAYYAPTAGRMEGFEIRKGSSAIRQGPYTNGGTINYLSTSIPRSLETRLEAVVGSEEQHRLRAQAGDSGDRYGWLLEAYEMEHGGFKELDGGGPTGFSLEDFLAKFRLSSRPEAPVRHALELKLGKTRQQADETYVGLTDADFRDRPYRRYVGSAGDRIVSDHEQIQLSYEMRPSERLRLTATAYRNDFFRNWAKLEKLGGIGVSTLLSEPESYVTELAILRGEIDSEPGALAVRNNRRDYFARGLQLVLDLRFDGAATEHELDIGLRVHEDAEDRFQEEDAYQIRGGARVLNELGRPGSHANRIASAEALALFVEDTISIGRWTLTPGLRVESIDLERQDFGRDDPSRSGIELEVRSNSLTEVIPGLGVSYELSPHSNVIAGVHRGFSPPAPGSGGEVEAEESVNLEFGYRHVDRVNRVDVVAFYNDYDNLLGTDTLSGGGAGSGDQFNGGAAKVGGLELGLGRQFLPVGRFVLPLGLTYTYTRAEFASSFDTSFADWAPSVTDGDEIPYVPRHQLSLPASLSNSRWALHLDGHHSAAMRTKAGSGAIPVGERIDGRTTFDLRAEVTLSQRLRLYAQALNLTDETYIAARRPAGLRPGLPRSVALGLRYQWSRFREDV